MSDHTDPMRAMKLRAKLAPPCRLEAGQTSADCPSGSAGHNRDGRLDLGDLIATPAGREVYDQALAARYKHEARLGPGHADAIAAFRKIIEPAIARLNGDVDDDAADHEDDNVNLNLYEKHDCNCGGARADDDPYDFEYGRRVMRANARAQLGEPSIYRAGSRGPGTATAPARADSAPAAANPRFRDALDGGR